MSLLSKVKSYFLPAKPAQDAAARDAITITVDGDTSYQRYDPFNFVPHLILYKKNDVKNWEHREAVARHDPYARIICYDIPYATFDDGFTYVDVDGEQLPALDPLLTELERLNHRRIFQEADRYARIHGWAAIYLSGKSRAATDAQNAPTEEERTEKLQALSQSPLLPGTPLGRLQVYAGERDINVHTVDYLGNPTLYEVVQSVKQSHQHKENKFLVHPSRLLVITPTPLRLGQVEGESALDPVWDPLILRRRLEYAMAFYGIKYGGGLLKAQKETGSWTDEEKADIQRELPRTSMTQALLAPSGATVEWMGPSSVVNYDAAIARCVKSIAAGARVPEDVFEGVSAGVVTGSQTNLQELYMTVSKNQELYEYYYDVLGRFLMPGLADQITLAHYKWAFAFTQSEKEQADVDLVRAQEDAIKLNWMSVNELREEKGLSGTEGGEIIQGIKQFETPLIQGEFGSPTENKEARQDAVSQGQKTQVQTQKEQEALAYASHQYNRSFKSFRELDAYLAPQSLVTRFCEEAGVGKGTYYDWRQKYDRP